MLEKIFEHIMDAQAKKEMDYQANQPIILIKDTNDQLQIILL